MLYAATFGRSQYRIPLRPASGKDEIAIEEDIISVYPNPSPNQVNITVSLEKGSEVSLEIIDVSGRVVSNLYKGSLAEGTHQFIWSGSNKAGQRMPGSYICRLLAGDKSQFRRVIISN